MRRRKYRYSKQGMTRAKPYRVRCIGPAALSDPEHYYYSNDPHRKVGMCEDCQHQIKEMRLSPMVENPVRGGYDE